MTLGYDNLAALLDKADALDREDGLQAYRRYHDLLQLIARTYTYEFKAVAAAFCALSPNNDYVGNLRSLVSMLAEKDPLQATVSTYRHCQTRAAMYLSGVPFLDHARGPKIRSFYRNITDPEDWAPVTVDGHMVAAWRNEDLVMKDALVGKRGYREIEHAVKVLAAQNFMLPNQMQATLWFTRKRIKRVKYDPQLDLLNLEGGAQRTMFQIEDIKPYPKRAGL